MNPPTPKVWSALARIKHWPTQIEADLAYRGVDVGWWHRGTLDPDGLPRLSSRRLLVLLDELPDHSAYKTALRGGNWPIWMRMLKTLTNETSLHRAGLYAGGDDAYEPLLFIDPIEALERAEQAHATAELAQEAGKHLYHRFGWS